MNIYPLLNHFNPFLLFSKRRNNYNLKHFTFRYKFISCLLWIVLIPFKIIDFIGLFLLFDFFRSRVLKTRNLNDFEITEAKNIFGDSIKYSKLKIRENSWMAKIGAKSAKKKKLAFVFIRTINFSVAINCKENKNDSSWLIHELVHTLHYKKLGIAYISEALRAQRNGGYYYGGIDSLKKHLNLFEFNLEQQAEIATHYYENLDDSNHNEVYSKFINQIKARDF